MQRLAVLALCAIVALATVWLLVRSGESTDRGERAGRSNAASPSAPSGSLSHSLSDAEPRPLRDGSGGGPEGGGGRFAGQSGAGASATQAARNGSTRSGPDAAPSDGQSSGQQAAPGSEDKALITPADVKDWARRQAETERSASAEAASPEASPSNSNSEETAGGVLSAEEIASRIEKVLPDGSMPPDELALARETERRRILQLSNLAADLRVPQSEEPSPDVTSERPAVTLPQSSLPALPPKPGPA